MRKTTYSEEYPEMLVEYFRVRLAAITASPVEELPVNERGGKGSSRAGAQRIYAEFPTLSGFSVAIGTHEQRFYSWAPRHPEFADAMEQCKSMTKHLLVNGMLDGRFNAQAAQFVAKNLTDMRDKIEIDSTVRAGEVPAALAALETKQLETIQGWLQAVQPKIVEAVE